MADAARPDPFAPEPDASLAFVPSADTGAADAASQTGSFDRIDSLCRSYTAEWARGRPDLLTYLGRVSRDEQPTLLRNLLECDVRRRRAAGDAPSTQEYVDRLPAEHADLVRRVFLDASSVSVAASWEPTPATGGVRAPAASRLGDYRLVRELGRGGMGAVFEAVHLGRGHRVALKTLPTVTGDSLHRFKREFRALADVAHPNLVGLRTLENDGGQWFITLDLLDGCDFLSYVRPGAAADEGRLRAGLAQLAAGVMALHARGIVHRDLKPGNVMVTRAGRVVVLDFGLVAEFGRAGGSAAAGAAGTPLYMAPEQAAGGSVGPAADWYAVGVMLHAALTGRLPFRGDVWQVMADKQRLDAPPVPARPDIPADLAALCARLLARDPAARPDVLQIAGAIATAPATAAPAGATDQLIGREAQHAALAAALADLRRTQSPVAVFIRGRSGEGKTSLAESFLAPLRKDGGLAVMSGRCYDRESVPFKALDTLIDALTAHLRALDAADAALLLPDDIGLLAEVFPVLRRCEVVAKAPRGRLDALDQQQVRQRAFAALRLLLERIGERTPVVWFIDDLQWGDVDSAGALFEVLRPPSAPPVLFLGSFRSDEADASPFLTEWAARQRQNGVDFGDRAVSVCPLSLDEAGQLVVNVVGRDDATVRRRAVQFHAQTGGNPFLLVELAGCFDPDADAFHATDIHGVLARKLDQLPPEAGPLLDAIAVSGQAVDLAEAAAAANLTDSPDLALSRMRNVRLLRVVGEKVDTYHDRIRYAVLERMPADPKRALHRRLAETIEQTAGGLTGEDIAAITQGQEGGSRESLARVYDLSYHYDAAGDQRRALAYALTAAAQARGQSALDVAEQQYAIAARNGGGTPSVVRFHISRGRGEALLLLGRYKETRDELNSALGLAERDYDVADVRGLIGELASKLGLIGESIENYEAGIRRLGLRVPQTRLGCLVAVGKQSAIQVIHSCFPWRLHRRSPDPAANLANHLLGRIDWAYYCNNVPKLIWASLVGLNRAERLPPSKALLVNYVVHANDMAVLGWHRRAARYYRAARALGEQLNDHGGVAMAVNHTAVGRVADADYHGVLAEAEPGRTAFVKLGDLWELHLGHLNRSVGHYGLGDLSRAAHSAQEAFEACVRHGDNYFAPAGVWMLARANRGRVPYGELISCVQLLPGNHLSFSHARMAEAYWHAHNGRTAEAVATLESAWSVCRQNLCLVTYNSCILNDLTEALRLHAEQLVQTSPMEATSFHRRWAKMAKWANRLSWFLPPERPRALRELSLAYAHRGRVRKAWKLAAKSCRIAEAQKAKYERAQSLLVLGRLGQRLGKPEAEEQVRDAQAEIDRIEGAVRDAIAARST